MVQSQSKKKVIQFYEKPKCFVFIKKFFFEEKKFAKRHQNATQLNAE